ncbi:MAG: response regulator, partial [Alphaproteobacteria bacterium]|nr:response regulator [Alphaproteobacteria bacterium]
MDKDCASSGKRRSRRVILTDHAADLGEAEEALAVAQFDAALLDLALPDGSGLSLLRSLRRQGNHVPIVIATAQDQISRRIAGLDVQADDHVVKPYDLGEIEARLRAQPSCRRRSSAGTPAWA